MPGFNADFPSVYREARELVSAEGFSAQTFVPVLKRCIQLVERVAKVSRDHGAQKKELVLALVRALIRDSRLSHVEKAGLELTLETIGPDIIEVALEGSVVAKHHIKKFFASCCGGTEQN